eukprot:403339843
MEIKKQACDLQITKNNNFTPVQNITQQMQYKSDFSNQNIQKQQISSKGSTQLLTSNVVSNISNLKQPNKQSVKTRQSHNNIQKIDPGKIQIKDAGYTKQQTFDPDHENYSRINHKMNPIDEIFEESKWETDFGIQTTSISQSQSQKIQQKYSTTNPNQSQPDRNIQKRSMQQKSSKSNPKNKNTSHQPKMQLSSKTESQASMNNINQKNQIAVEKKDSNKSLSKNSIEIKITERILETAGRKLQQIPVIYSFSINQLDAQLPQDKFKKELEELFDQEVNVKKQKKLFSIYKSKQFKAQLEGKFEENLNSDAAFQQRESTVLNQNERKSVKQHFQTSLHYYKRDLTPLRENYAMCSEKTPYKSNFQNYQGSLMSKGLKDGILNNLGDGVKCISSNTKNKSIQTFTIEVEKSKLRRLNSENNAITQKKRKILGHQHTDLSSQESQLNNNIPENQSVRTSMRRENGWSTQIKNKKMNQLQNGPEDVNKNKLKQMSQNSTHQNVALFKQNQVNDQNAKYPLNHKQQEYIDQLITQKIQNVDNKYPLLTQYEQVVTLKDMEINSTRLSNLPIVMNYNKNFLSQRQVQKSAPSKVGVMPLQKQSHPINIQKLNEVSFHDHSPYKEISVTPQIKPEKSFHLANDRDVNQQSQLLINLNFSQRDLKIMPDHYQPRIPKTLQSSIAFMPNQLTQLSDQSYQQVITQNFSPKAQFNVNLGLYNEVNFSESNNQNKLVLSSESNRKLMPIQSTRDDGQTHIENLVVQREFLNSRGSIDKLQISNRVMVQSRGQGDKKTTVSRNISKFKGNQNKKQTEKDYPDQVDQQPIIRLTSSQFFSRRLLENKAKLQTQKVSNMVANQQQQYNNFQYNGTFIQTQADFRQTSYPMAINDNRISHQYKNANIIISQQRRSSKGVNKKLNVQGNGNIETETSSASVSMIAGIDDIQAQQIQYQKKNIMSNILIDCKSQQFQNQNNYSNQFTTQRSISKFQESQVGMLSQEEKRQSILKQASSKSLLPKLQ